MNATVLQIELQQERGEASTECRPLIFQFVAE